ncbi:sugar tyrosine-protein kinase [Azospirillum sp. TSO35-2]|uniref:sugar tyrosine-protein kinase n=1 Tax=Azospirillum sp. TSO35-2 TaxID=716796 RepID=UPI0011B6E324|nr:sugar tyrosine-protein kinase [Azospirillum sp. TSO35-2]
MEDHRVTLMAFALLLVTVGGYVGIMLASPALAVLVIVVASWINLAIILRLTR